jgi:lysophospholipid acyltransferase (LPLAT)-like uncharacterized protein
MSRKKKLSRRIGPGLWSFVIASLIRLVGLTLRFSVEDRAGIREKDPDHSLLWIFWHNRVFTVPFVYRKFLRNRHGAVLTSPSGDGEILSRTMKRFGVDSVRGSSNKRGSAAMKEMVAWLKADARNDIAITPDGPRGPVYRLQPGVVKMAQLTGVPVFPVHVRYEKCFTLRTWDRFMIPKPFSRVHVILDEFRTVPPTDSDEAFEVERLKLEACLRAGADDEISSASPPESISP